MKLIILLFLVAPAYSFSLFGIRPQMFNKRMNEMENSIQKQFSDNELEITGLKNRIDKVELNISAQAQAVAKIQAGYDRSVSQNVGRDMTTTTTNDSDLMKYIFQVLSGLFLSIIAFMKSRLTAKDNSIKDKDERIEYLENSRHKYQDLWLMKLDPEFAEIKRKMEKEV